MSNKMQNQCFILTKDLNMEDRGACRFNYSEGFAGDCKTIRAIFSSVFPYERV